MIHQTLKQLISRNSYIPLNTVVVHKKQLLSNLTYLTLRNGHIQIAPVLKSNAYGHGLVEVAKLLDKQKCPFFCVDSLYEAYELLKNHIKTPILILGYVDPENLKVKKLPFSYVVSDLKTLAGIHQYQPHAAIHLEVNSGMNRLGINMEDISAFLAALKHYPSLTIAGVMSHFAASEEPERILTQKQIVNFEKVLEAIRLRGLDPQWIHIQASAGLLNMPQLPCTVARVGLSLYGLDPNCVDTEHLKPAMQVISKLVQVRPLTKGESVGYGGTFTASKDMTLGVIPFGYFEGLDRRLSNRGSVLIDDVVCPILGRVSMNIATVDVSAVHNPRVGQQVIVFSNNPKDQNSFHQAAETCQTIPYELLVHIVPTLKRVYI